MTLTTFRRLAATTLAIALPSVASAQFTPSAAANGMGGAYLPLAKGADALWINPANLALENSPTWSLQLGGGGLSAAMLGLDLKQMYDFVRNQANSATAKQEILNNIPAQGTELRGRIQMPVATLQMGRIALGVAVGGTYDYYMGRDFVDLALNGYDNTRTNYQIGNTNGRQAWYLDFAAAYARKLGPLAVGVTGHYIMPRGLDNTRIFEPQYDLVNRTISVTGYSAGVSGGSGFSLDVGATTDLGPLTVSGTVENIAGNVKWGENLG